MVTENMGSCELSLFVYFLSEFLIVRAILVSVQIEQVLENIFTVRQS